jgi:DNA-binding NarL/FixJ family response regulator
MSVRVLLADDERLVRAGFRMLLKAEADIEVVGEASDGRQAVEAAARLRPDVVLMDIRMPILNGLEATRQLVKATDAPPRVLVLTTFDLDEYVYEALRAGASGFLLKDAPEEQLLAAIRVVAAGGALFAPLGDPTADRGVQPPAAGQPPAATGTGQPDPPGRSRSSSCSPGACPTPSSPRPCT